MFISLSLKFGVGLWVYQSFLAENSCLLETSLMTTVRL